MAGIVQPTQELGSQLNAHLEHSQLVELPVRLLPQENMYHQDLIRQLQIAHQRLFKCINLVHLLLLSAPSVMREVLAPPVLLLLAQLHLSTHSSVMILAILLLTDTKPQLQLTTQQSALVVKSTIPVLVYRALQDPIALTLLETLRLLAMVLVNTQMLTPYTALIAQQDILAQVK